MRGEGDFMTSNIPNVRTSDIQTTVETLTGEQIEYYRDNGFVRVQGIISPGEAAAYREAALACSNSDPSGYNNEIFHQLVNVWRHDETMRQLTFHQNIATIAEKLAGVSLRLWHDQILIKPAVNSKSTEFHQDQPYWPHANSTHPISCWIALGDVPVEKGCMTFLPRSHKRTDLPAQMLDNSRSLFSICPELEWEERVTVPLRAGDCTFHHGRCAHMATPNFTEDARVAHVVIFIDDTTTFEEQPHPVTHPLGLETGQLLEGEMFPTVSEFAKVLQK